MKYLILVLLCPLFSSAQDFQLRDAFRDLQAVLLVDAKDDRYKELLEDVHLHPKIAWSEKALAKKKYSEFLTKIFPYMLEKVKIEDFSSHSKIFHHSLALAQGLASSVNNTKLDKSIYSFLTERFRIEQELKACSEIKTQFRGQDPLLKAQLRRVDLSNMDYAASELKSVSDRLRYISLEFSR